MLTLRQGRFGLRAEQPEKDIMKIDEGVSWKFSIFWRSLKVSSNFKIHWFQVLVINEPGELSKSQNVAKSAL